MELANGSHSELVSNLNDVFRSKVWPVSAFVGAEILFGILGNSFVLFVFAARYNTWSTYRCFVLYLGLIDITSCFTTMPAEIVTELFWFNYSFPVVCQIKSFFNAFTACGDVLCLFTIAIDRYKRTCVPTTPQISPTLAIYLCIGITFTAIGMAVPVAIASGITHFNRKANETNVSVAICGVDDSYAGSQFMYHYHIVFQTVVCLSLGPMLLLYGVIALKVCREGSNGTAGREMYQALLSHDDEDNAEKLDRKQTVVLFLISLFSVLSTVMYLVFLSFFKTKVTYTLNQTVAYLFLIRLYFLNHVINPIIYGWLDPRFRMVFLSMFRCRSSKEAVGRVNKTEHSS